MRYFWNSFEDEQIIESFKCFIRLIDESVFEVRRVLLYGFCQLLEEFKSHSYFKNPFLITKLKNTFNDENEKVRRAFIHFLLKIKKVDSQSDTSEKINFTKIVDLRNIASALAVSINILCYYKPKSLKNFKCFVLYFHFLIYYNFDLFSVKINKMDFYLLI